jgi:fimbrial chaperone protein
MQTKLIQTTLALGLLCGAGRVLAAGLNVSPVQVSLTADEPRALITLRNEGDVEQRFQVSAMNWGEDPDKGMVLSPTEEIVFFPALLAVKPGEAKNVRIGTAAPLEGPVERTYRIFVEELPAAPKPEAKPAVRVLTRVGIPVFVAPQKPLEGRRVSAISLAAGKAALEVQNAGNVHFRVELVRLEGQDKSGAKIFETQVAGWYVLAGGRKPYALEIPRADCARTRKLLAVVKAGDQELRQSLDTPQGACGP